MTSKFLVLFCFQTILIFPNAIDVCKTMNFVLFNEQKLINTDFREVKLNFHFYKFVISFLIEKNIKYCIQWLSKEVKKNFQFDAFLEVNVQTKCTFFSNYYRKKSKTKVSNHFAVFYVNSYVFCTKLAISYLFLPNV